VQCTQTLLALVGLGVSALAVIRGVDASVIEAVPSLRLGWWPRIPARCGTATGSWLRPALEYPFVRGIASGELARARFAYHVGQDAAFLDAFCRAYALALAKSPDQDGLIAFRELLDGAADELRLHQGYAARWDVDLRPAADPATSAYTTFLLAVAALEPVGHIAAAMIPCLRLYAYLGQQLAARTNPASPYREWVTTYSSPDFEALTGRLEELLNSYGGDPDRLASLYRQAMELELRFFDAAIAAPSRP
jgi:thiaminase (transcriptional activator TenA)